MIDPFGREITYLRVSVTDRCDFRCVYCMAEHMTFLPRAELLTLEELERFCAAFVRKGVRRIRITGGEPLVRRNLPWLLERLGALVGRDLDELTLTTNGSQLSRFAGQIAAAGRSHEGACGRRCGAERRPFRQDQHGRSTELQRRRDSGHARMGARPWH